LEDGNTVWLDDLPVGPIGGDYTPELPFSFRYGDRLSGVLLPTWDLKRSLRKLDEKRTEHSLTYTDLKTGLEARWVAVAYEDFPTVEWTLYFKNTSASPTPILENIQELTHFKLLPGEEVRSPLIVLQFWKGDWIRAQNVWRKWMIAHNLPRPGGKLPPPQMAAGSNRNLNEAQDANEENQKTIPDRWLEEGFKLDYWWIDAGWYPSQQGWQMTGTWEPDRKRFPNGFRPVADHLHSKGVKLILWFEPERVRPGTWLAENHPEWLLGREGENKRLSLGNPDALTWLISHLDKMITEEGSDLYRQ